MICVSSSVCQLYPQGFQCSFGDSLIFFPLISYPLSQRGNDSESCIHRLKITDNRTGNIMRQCPHHRLIGKIHRLLTFENSGKVIARQQTAGGRLHITFHAG